MERVPLISVLMAVYHPPINWLEEQLCSLDLQSYPDLELLICDDCPEYPVEEEIFKRCVKKIPWRLIRNSYNEGSNKASERLTMMAQGEYIAYCDQDDIWHPDKIEKLYGALRQNPKAGLVCADMCVIDAQGRKKAESIREIRSKLRFGEGAGLFPQLLRSNFVTGCDMLISADLAREAVPFCPYLVHDHWLAIYVSTEHEIGFVPESLIDYRIHDKNQTGVLSGVNSRADYVKLCLFKPLQAMTWLENFYKESAEKVAEIQKIQNWYRARIAHYHGSWAATASIWRGRELGKLSALFDLIGPYLPEWLFLKAISFRRNRG